MKQIGLGVVGLRFGLHIIEAQILQGTGASCFKLAAICDQDAARLAMVSGKHPEVTAYSSLDELLRDDAVEAVALFSGPNGRAQVLGKIIRSGRDVMTTKPFEMNSAKAAAVLGEARALKRVIHLNSPSPILTDDLGTLREWQIKYDLGRPILGSAQVWYLGNMETQDGSWYDDPDLCPGGVMLRLGIYGINDLLQIFGEPVEVQAMGSRIRTGRPTPDLASLTIRFREGGIAHIHTALCLESNLGGKMGMSIFFERGAVHRNAPGQNLSYPADGNVMTVMTGKGEDFKVETLNIVNSSNLYQWNAFHEAINLRNENSSLYHQQIVNGTRVIEAMARAFKSGRCEKIPT